jgi:hypothetical protein
LGFHRRFRDLAEYALSGFCSVAYEGRSVSCTGNVITHEIPVASVFDAASFDDALADLEAYVREYASDGRAQRDFLDRSNATLRGRGRAGGRLQGDASDSRKILAFLDRYPIVEMVASHGRVAAQIGAKGKRKDDGNGASLAGIVVAAVAFALVALALVAAVLRRGRKSTPQIEVYGDAGVGVLVSSEDGDDADSALLARDCVESDHWFWGTPSNSSKFSFRRRIEPVFHDSWTIRPRSPSSPRRLERDLPNVRSGTFNLAQARKLEEANARIAKLQREVDILARRVGDAPVDETRAAAAASDGEPGGSPWSCAPGGSATLCA